jgi:hypothetical protein
MKDFTYSVFYELSIKNRQKARKNPPSEGVQSKTWRVWGWRLDKGEANLAKFISVKLLMNFNNGHKQGHWETIFINAS